MVVNNDEKNFKKMKQYDKKDKGSSAQKHGLGRMCPFCGKFNNMASG